MEKNIVYGIIVFNLNSLLSNSKEDCILKHPENLHVKN